MNKNELFETLCNEGITFTVDTPEEGVTHIEILWQERGEIPRLLCEHFALYYTTGIGVKAECWYDEREGEEAEMPEIEELCPPE